MGRNASLNGIGAIAVLTVFAGISSAAETSTNEAAARGALRQAVHFFSTQASADGGYVYRISEDLTLWEGEGTAGPQIAWIEPPGTPAVGMAYLKAWKLCGEPVLLEAAQQTADALIRGQLESGGWDNLIHFDPEQRKRYAYRVDGRTDGRNVTTLDDDKTQSCLRFLMELDHATDSQDERLNEAVQYAISALFAAQYPNGAWPQRFREPPDPAESPVLPASYPEDWPREFPSEKYDSYYTLNDNTISDCIETMLLAWELYEDPQCLEAVKHAGAFFLIAQMPDPQPGWAQQYNRQMHPAWARKFEPPAISGGESQGVMRTLMRVYRHTGEARYLEPIPRALSYYRESELNDGRLARFYELKTNRPLYFTRDYQLTYIPDDLPTHYGFIVSSKLDSIEREYEKLVGSDADELEPPSLSELNVRPPSKLTANLEQQAAAVIDQLDDRGAWVTGGELRNYDGVTRVIDSRVFADNLQVLARYLGAVRK